tara:strand:- start:3546 stop:3833 length:288 start_codon:yes stop_codon:yes gene_type:complete
MKKNIKKMFYKKKAEIIISEINQESIILEISSGIYFKTNYVGTFILDFINEKKSFFEILDKTSQNFNVTKEHCINDVQDFLNILIKKNLVEISDK